jgi:Stress responsive A/B Barrel Domain
MSRIVVCAALFAAACLLMVQRAEPLVAQEKKDKKDAKDNAAMLEKQVAALKQDLAQAEKQINALKADIVQGANALAAQKAANAKLEAALKKDKGNDAKDDKTIKDLQTTIDGFRAAGLVHVVILKLKADSSGGEAQSVIDDTYSQLAKIKPVRGVWAGKPVATGKGTPEAATDYTVALVFLFDDAAGLKSYLKDPAHDKFADKHLKKWETPVVYDFEPKKAAP